MRIRVLGAHNTERQKQKQISLLIDGVLAIDAGSLTSTLSLEEQQKIRGLLLTHQHYDHIRDIPSLAMSLFLGVATTEIYSIPPALDAVARHLLNNEIYPDFRQKPEQKPTLRFTVIEPHQPETIEGYTVTAVTVKHSVPTVGYQITDASGKTFFYTADTGPGLAESWQHVSPQLLIIEVTSSNRFSDWAAASGHLSPKLLKEELAGFKEVKGYLPPVLAIHMSPNLEEEITAELAVVARELDCSITIAQEEMEINL